MSNKAYKVLLVDDNYLTNCLNEILIEETGSFDEVQLAENALEALDFLEADPIQPNLIFIELNMPDMDGWKFIEAYNKMKKNDNTKTVFIILTSILNPDDKNIASDTDGVAGIYEKPLTSEIIDYVIEHFL